MPNSAKLCAWLSPLALMISLPATAIQVTIDELIDNLDFEITDQRIVRNPSTNQPTEFEVIEIWSGSSDPVAYQEINIDYVPIKEDPAFPNPIYDAFEFKFLVISETLENWSSYSFTISGLGGLDLDNVLVGRRNELDDIDNTPVFADSEIIGDTLTFYNGLHASDTMVSYELLFDLNALYNAGIDKFDVTQTVVAASSVPEPPVLALMAAGLIGLGFTRRKRIQA